MADLNGFDASQVEPNTPFEPLPAGKYLAVIIESETKPNRARDGSYLQLVFQVAEGEYRGRKLWARLNLDNPSALAVRISRGHLSSICRAVGVLRPRDSAELHNLPLLIKVGCKKREDNGEMTNEITDYEPREAGTGQPQQATDDVSPWRRD